MQYQHTKREPEMAELIEGSERDRRRLAELLNGGAFLFLILGSYEVLMNFINPVLEFFKKGKQTA